MRLANWAADLQRSLQNERTRFEALARSERAVWLTERLGECVQDGSIVPISQGGIRNQGTFGATTGALVKQGVYTRRREREFGPGAGVDRNDPLGLLQLNADLKRRGWIALQVVGSFGIIGGLAFWITRNWQGEGGSELGFWDLSLGRFVGDW